MNLIWKNDGWYINGNDRVKVGDIIEVAQPDGTWKSIKVGKDAQEVFHPEPAGKPFDASMEVRRPVLNR